jgi:replicative DNA helicase
MTENTSTKIPPNSKESEMIVLGCMLTAETSLNVAADLLEEVDFYYSEHKLIFEVLKDCFLQDKPADIHIAAEELKRRGKLKGVGGVAYLTTLAQYAGTAAHIEEYIELVRSKSVLRRMIHAAQDIEKEAFADPGDVENTLDGAQQKFFHISQSVNTGGALLIKELLTGTKAASQLPYLKELQERQEKYQTRGPEEGTITGIPTHFLELDKIINGLAPSNLMILAARPAMGKTALALNIAENICFKNNLPVGIFSLEMTAEQLLHRIICSQSEVESDKIRTGALSGIDYQRVVSSVNMMQSHTMVIDDQPGLKITDLRARARRMKEAHGIEFLVIDYLQLLTGSGNFKSQENRQLEVSEISRLLKTLARELNIPILCLSQLSRKVEERTNHRPMISDLRESGCLTGDAQIKDAETGKLYTIKELAERKEQTPLLVYGVDKDLKLGKHTMVKAFYSGKKVVYELKTRTGRTIKASGNHPFLKLNGWSRLDTLAAGDKIALMQSAVKWDEILSIKELGVEDVYDATVETVHNFVANDIIVHNSIEQDSDLVMLLLRRDYYDPYDKPGTADLNIAKNRHGGIGNINLAFRKEIAKFGNYSQLRGPDTPENDEAFAAFSPR